MCFDLCKIGVGENVTRRLVAFGTQVEVRRLDGDVLGCECGMENANGLGYNFLSNAIARDDSNFDFLHTAILLYLFKFRKSVHMSARTTIVGASSLPGGLMSFSYLPTPHGTIGTPHAMQDAARETVHTVVDDPSRVLRRWEGGPFPTACIDGRPTVDEATVASPAPALRLAGGTVSVWVGLLLSAALPMPASREEALGGLHRLCVDLAAHGWPLATHCDDHAAPPQCGCGAADHLSAILGILAEESDTISSIINQWGFDANLQIISQKAQVASSILTGLGKAMYDTVTSVDEQAGPQVLGAHEEALTVINTHPGMVVDRTVVTSLLSSHMMDTPKCAPQCFVVDVWALPAIASAMSAPKDFAPAVAAFNAAALLALCSETMTVTVL